MSNASKTCIFARMDSAFERVKKSAALSIVMAGLDPAIQYYTEFIGFFKMARSSRAMTTELFAVAPIFSHAPSRE